MITETIINIDAIMPYLICIAGVILFGIALFLLHNLGGLKLFSNHDIKLTQSFLDKFPLVSTDFMKKPQKEQLIENNQEIHELNKRVEHLEQYVVEINDRIQKQLDMILGEIKKNG